MPEPQTDGQYAQTHKEIAEAFGLAFTPAIDRDIVAFKKWRDFPKRKAEGYDCDELVEFIARNKSKIASRKAAAQLLDPDAKTTAADLKLIQQGVAGGEKPPKMGDADTLTALARALEKHYQGRIRILIDKQALNRWRKNELPVRGAPLPPGRIGDSSRYDVGEWVAWFDRWMLDFYKIGTNAELDGEAATLEREQRKNELERIEHERFERSVERGKYVEREKAKRTILAAIKQFHKMVKDADERGAPIARLNKLHELGVSTEAASAFHEFDIELGVKMTDEREQQCAALGRETEDIT